MNYHPIGWNDTPSGGNGHVNHRRPAVREAVDFGGRFMTELRALPREQDRGP